MYWLFKEEPTHYSFDDLLKEKKTTWEGVHNNLALKHLRNVKKGDLIFFYHTGEEKQIVGVMKAFGDAFSLDRTPLEKSKEVAVEVIPLRRLEKPVTLREIKEDRRFKDFPLVKFSRLSVMPVSDEQWRMIEERASK